MRRCSTVLPVRGITAFLAVAVSFGVSAAAAHGQAPSGDSVVAQGRTSFFEIPIDPFATAPTQFVFDVNATSGPSGENAGGQVALYLTLAFPQEGPVTCLNVLGVDPVLGGNVAIVGALLTPGFSGPNEGTKILLVDNGPPGAEPPDRFAAGFSRPTPDCGNTDYSSGGGSTDLAVIEGDVAVTDSVTDPPPPPPPPTSKSECRNGGYERFGFKNQGECVAFVERGTKQ